MGYTEKDGRLYDQKGSDMGPAKARIDPKGTEIPETRIIHHPKENACVAPWIPLQNPQIEKKGERIDLIAKSEPSEVRDPRIAYSEALELIACRKVAGPWVLSLLDTQIKAFQALLEDQERNGFAFQAEQSKIYLAALETAREGAKNALDASSETLPHTCGSGLGCFACAVHRPIGDFVKDIK